MKTETRLWLALYLFLLIPGCGTPSSDDVKNKQQESNLQAGVASVGIPNIKNWREMRILKEVYELRDQANYSTYSYLWSDYRGCLVPIAGGHSEGYGIPYSTEYSNPMVEQNSTLALPQAEPNGLFSPPASNGTWVMLKDPNGSKVAPVYVEPYILSSPFPLTPVCKE